MHIQKMDKEQKVVEPSIWDRWRAVRGEKRAHKPREFVVVTGDIRLWSMFKNTVLFVADVTVAVLGWAFHHGIGILVIAAIIFGIIAISTSPTSGLKKINLMWEEHPGMRPHITEAAKDGTITKWERVGLDGTLRRLIDGNNMDHEQEQLQHKIDAEKRK